MSYHGGFPFSHHQDNFLKNCDFYSSVLTNIPNARFTVIPFNSNVVEFYKNIYSILYRILFNTISNKLQLIRRGTGIIPFFQYEITLPLGKGIATNMNITQEYVGIAFIDSQGFGSECGVALARLCNQQKRPAFDYTGGYVPVYKAHLANLTDCDASGVAIG